MPGKEFERGRDPMSALDLGLYQKVFNRTSKPFNQGGAYSFIFYGPKNWKDIILWMKDEGYSPGEVEQILRSKLMRWASDSSEHPGKTTLEDFKKYNTYYMEKAGGGQTEIDSFLEEYGPMTDEEMNEDVGAPMSTLGNTPGMGNATPASSAGLNTNGPAGSGDKWDSSIGPMHTQAKTVSEHLNEQNINPHDKLGVAMAQKMGIDIPFKKGKGKKDVEQKRIDEDPDLSSKITTFEDWAKKFVNEGKDPGIFEK